MTQPLHHDEHGDTGPALFGVFWEVTTTQELILDDVAAWIGRLGPLVVLVPMAQFADAALKALNTAAIRDNDAALLYGDPTGVLVLGASPLNDPTIKRHFARRDTVRLTDSTASERLGIAPARLREFKRLVREHESHCLIGHDADFLVTFRIDSRLTMISEKD